MAQAEAQTYPNVEVGEEVSSGEPMQVHPGGGVDFDAVEAMSVDAGKPVDKPAENNESVGDEPKQAKEDEVVPAKGEVVEEDVQEDSAYEAKLFKAKAGDSEVEYDFNASIPVKVKGEETEVPLQELVNSYSGKVVYDKKFQELSDERKGFKSRVETLNDYVGQIYDQAASIAEAENKPQAAMKVLRLLGNLSGKDPMVMVKQIRSAFVDEANARANMSAEEIETLELKEELEYNRIDKEQQQRMQQSQAERQKLLDAKFDVGDKYDIEEKEYDSIVKTLDKEFSDQQVSVSPEMVVHYHRGIMAHQAIVDYDQNLAANKEVFDMLVDEAVKDPSLKKDDLTQLLKEAVGGEAPVKEKNSAKNLSRKLANSSQATPKKVAEKKTELMTFEDLWEEAR